MARRPPRRPSRRAAPRWPFALVTALGLVAGAASAGWTMKHGGGAEEHRGWRGSRVTGSPDADPWTRAQVALTGLLALNRSQAIYFTRSTDDAGAPLREDCRYRVNGGRLPGKWWSVTVYAADDYLPLNDDDALSFDATEVRPDARGQWTATLAPQRPAKGAWASTRQAGAFDVTLRIYNPSPRAQADFGTIPFPSAQRLDCGGAA
ncbi:DUF1214 domain-containing protein [Novosphingobium sp. KCTC 2891]|uniref:DUF1214 domain-containing protein n=1 Tax=Novosphingobium sp. KCTC 2891 TaxID=2989730 RepID=UPI002222BEC0|nr:DUF1214 domain-containing protein [Novosphingobium sp. KCTC 2891]MCW1381813.1 DUF1214 domain-containing protein [Novosphingobium sp. KCTC 2891]